MYFRRLKTFLGLVAIVLVVWLARLALLQLYRGGDYLQQARDSLINPPQVLPSERGRIVDRYGRLLARDEPTLGVAVEYGILGHDVQYLAGGRYGRNMSRASAERLAGPAQEKYDKLLAQIAELCGITPEGLAKRRAQVVKQVTTIKAAVSQRVGRSTVIPAERIAHILIPEISPDAQAKVLTLVGRFNQEEHCTAGVVLASMQHRSYPLGECLAHVVGTEGEVAEADVNEDPFAADDFRRYLPGDRKGLGGVEQSAEAVLRGRRGVIQNDRDGNTLKDIPPVRGGTVRLTIDSELQKHLYRVLAHHVDAKANRYRCGGAVVVINVGDRTVNGDPLADGDILALVSYPSFDPEHWRDMYEELKKDDRGQPMLSRTVQAVYPPGSIIKPAVLAGALQSGRLNLDDKLECKGSLFGPNKPFKCWAPYGHGQPLLSPSDALKYSCNVFFYRVGERMTLPPLTRWLERFDLGRRQDIGLPEERPGAVPTPQWLATHPPYLPAFSVADARNTAIGQGKLGVTPLAAANMIAAIARGGTLVHPRLVMDSPPRPPVDLGIDPAIIKVVHEGMVRVVNEEHGTARDSAFMDNITLAGKTGSATTSRRWINCKYAQVDGKQVRTEGELFPPLQDWVVRRKRVDGVVTETVEVSEFHPAHAWFAAFAPAEKPAIAIACLIEYGMKGGPVAGPLARDVVQVCLNMGYLEAHSPDQRVRDVPGLAEPLVAPPGEPGVRP